MIYSARLAAETATSSNGSGLNALARVAFEKHLGDARRHVIGAMNAQAEFWVALQSPQPSIGAIQRVLKRMHGSIVASERAFHELLVLNASSLIVLRMVRTKNAVIMSFRDADAPCFLSTVLQYAEFCLYVSNNSSKV
jgi:hypothetical protein